MSEVRFQLLAESWLFWRSMLCISLTEMQQEQKWLSGKDDRCEAGRQARIEIAAIGGVSVRPVAHHL